VLLLLLIVPALLLHPAFSTCYKFRKMKSKPKEKFSFENFPPEDYQLHWTKKLRFFCDVLILFLWGFLKELLWWFLSLFYLEPGYSALKNRMPGLKGFYVEHVYRRLEDCFSRPITSSPGSVVTVVKRKRVEQEWWYPWKELKLTKDEEVCVNLGSFNYLGFGNVDPNFTPLLMDHIRRDGLSTGATRDNPEGSYEIHQKLEKGIAEFLGKEEALVIGMGFATNSAIISSLIDSKGDGNGCLILSDSLNHNSMVEGIRLSGAKVQVFKHNDMIDLERKLRQANDIGKKWRKIIIFAEGIYSMEGDFCRLREICALKNRYGAFLYLDEAHSIGAVGETGRGVTELLGVPTSAVDIMMGTFSKSFGSQGGYISGKSSVIQNLRHTSAATVYGISMSPACAAQALLALNIIRNGSTQEKQQMEILKRNSNYFRQKLIDMGFYVLGDMDSPVIPILVNPGCIQEFSNWLLDNGVAVVVVMFPAVPITGSRARFCISSSHTLKQLDYALNKIQEVGLRLNLLFCQTSPCYINIEYQNYIRTVPMDLPIYPKKTFQYFASGQARKIPILKRRLGTSFCIQDALGFIQNTPDELYDSIQKHLLTKGFGSCGPVFFYGTTLHHLKLERVLAKFYEKDRCLYFSNGISTSSSVIPALLQKKDIVFCYQKAHYGIKAGLKMAKATIIYFIDLFDLMQKLLTIESFIDTYDQRYIIAEGLFACDGTICDLPGLIQIKENYNMSLIIDESLSLGSVGVHGVIDYYNHRNNDDSTQKKYSMKDLDIVLGSLELTVGSIGGFCCINKNLASYLQIFSSGYIFSTASPAVAAIWATEILEKHMGTPAKSGDQMRFEKLQKNVTLFHHELSINCFLQENFHIQGDHYLVYLRLKNCEDMGTDIYMKILEKIQEKMNFRIEIWKCPKIQQSLEMHLNIESPPPSAALRVSINCLHTKNDMLKYIACLATASKSACKWSRNWQEPGHTLDHLEFNAVEKLGFSDKVTLRQREMDSSTEQGSWQGLNRNR